MLHLVVGLIIGLFLKVQMFLDAALLDSGCGWVSDAVRPSDKHFISGILSSSNRGYMQSKYGKKAQEITVTINSILDYKLIELMQHWRNFAF